MKNAGMTIWLVAVAILAMSAVGQAAFYLENDDYLLVDTYYDNGVLYDTSTADVVRGGRIHNAYVNDNATLNILEYRYRTWGQNIGTTYAYNTSTVDISGGEVGSLRAYDISTVDISGGKINNFYAYDSSTVDISGGEVGSLLAYDISTVDISGGNVIRVNSRESSIVNIFGYDFRASGGANIVDNEVIGTGLLTGKWFDGESFIIDVFTNFSSATINVIIIQVTVPDVVGMTQADAESAITSEGFVVGDVSATYDNEVPEGNVISQSPEGDTEADIGSAVNLVISLGAPVVPEVVGMTQAEAQTAITSVSLVVGTVETAYDDFIPEGSVISQSPDGGTQVSVGSPVDLIVSLGVPVVPNVIGLTQSDAESAILAVSLIVGDVTTVYDNEVPEGNVISQSPDAGTQAGVGSAVDLVISLGVEQVMVPDVVGMTQSDAEATIVAADFVLGAVEMAYHDSVPQGNVISQSPESGNQAPVGSSVDLVISLGVEQVTVPDVLGMTQADAESTIVAADLVVGEVTTEYDYSVPEGNIITQSPDSGIQIDIGSAVDLVVSLGAPVPALVSISPSSAPQGTSVVATLKGEFTSFNNDGSTVLDVWLSTYDSEIDGTDFQGIDATTIEASFNIPADAPIGRWDVNVNCSVDGHLTLEDAFLVYIYPDLTGDGRVDYEDFMLFARHWLEESPLVGWWKFDETEGPIAHDSSIYNNHGILMNGPVWTEDGALLFDGVDDYVQVPHSTSLTFESEITVSAWVYLNNFADWWTKIVIKPHTEYAGPWEMFTLDLPRSAPYPRFIISDGADGGATASNSEVLLNMNQWYHIVGTYDGSTISLYLDGQLIDSKPADITIGKNDMPVCIGGRLGIESLDGLIKDVRIYNRGFNQTEVQELYQNP